DSRGALAELERTKQRTLQAQAVLPALEEQDAVKARLIEQETARRDALKAELPHSIELERQEALDGLPPSTDPGTVRLKIEQAEGRLEILRRDREDFAKQQLEPARRRLREAQEDERHAAAAVKYTEARVELLRELVPAVESLAKLAPKFARLSSFIQELPG